MFAPSRLWRKASAIDPPRGGFSFPSCSLCLRGFWSFFRGSGGGFLISQHYRVPSWSIFRGGLCCYFWVNSYLWGSKTTRAQGGNLGLLRYIIKLGVLLVCERRAAHPQRFVSMSKDTTKSAENKKAALKKARKKYFSYGLAVNLANLSPRPKLFHSYLNTLACAKTLVVDEQGIAHSKYCKNRWCPLCQSIRIAKLIDGYKGQLEQYPELYFVTLTRPTVPAEGLKEQREKMMHAFTAIRNSKHFRKNKWSGLRKAECTIRPDELYHFHYHVLINSKEGAEFMVRRWLELNPESDPQAQNIEAVDRTNHGTGKGALLEIFKYFTKLIAKLRNDDGTEQRFINYRRLNVIFEFMRGQQVFKPFGSLKPVPEDFEDEELTADINIERANSIWQWVVSDWYDIDTGEALTGYVPAGSMVELLDHPEA